MSFDNDGAAPGAPVPTERNPLALASLIVGVVSLVLCMAFVPAVVGLILGLIALRQIRSSGAGGRGMAIGGTVASAVSLLLGVVVIAAAVSSDTPDKTGASKPPSSPAATSTTTSPAPKTPKPSPTTAPPTTPKQTPTVASVTVERVEASLKQSYGLSPSDSWTALCVQDPGFYPYPCAIASMELSSAGVLRITVQEALGKADAEQYAHYALNFLCATDTTAAEFASISWVEIADTSGGTRGQKMASGNPLCSRNR